MNSKVSAMQRADRTARASASAISGDFVWQKYFKLLYGSMDKK